MILEKLKMYNEFLRLCNKNWVKVTFTKADGSAREMIVVPKSRWSEFAPPKAVVEPGSPEKKAGKSNPNNAVVLEDKVGWRSFRIDSLVAVEDLGEKWVD